MDEPIKPHRPLPWATRPGEADDTLPADDTSTDGEPCCARDAIVGFECTRDIGHDGFHRAGTGAVILAEWVRDDPKPPAALVAESPAELDR